MYRFFKTLCYKGLLHAGTTYLILGGHEMKRLERTRTSSFFLYLQRCLLRNPEHLTKQQKESTSGILLHRCNSL